MNIVNFVRISLAISFLAFAGCKTVSTPFACGRYDHQTQFFPFPLSIHILEIDPQICRFEIEPANPHGIGVVPVADIAKRRQAKAAINAGFFLDGAYKGVNAHILKIGNRWFSDPRLNRGAMGWSDGGRITTFGRLGMNWQMKIANRNFPITRLNKPRSNQNAILFTDAIGQSTQNTVPGLDIIIEDEAIKQILKDQKNSSVPKNGYVYSVGHQSGIDLKELMVGMPAQPTFRFEPKALTSNEALKNDAWSKMDNILGGTPILVSNGKVVKDFSIDKTAEAFLEMPRPRTAVGIKKNKKWLLVVVDGDDPYQSYGLTMTQLASFMADQGAMNSLNLDGGSSSTMVLNGTVVNKPARNTPESVGDAILVFQR